MCDRKTIDHKTCDSCPEQRSCLGVREYEQDDFEAYNDNEADDYRDEMGWDDGD